MSTPIINSSNKKFALIICSNYYGTSSQLSGCINDGNHLKSFLIDRAGYSAQNILMLADDGININPTKKNILDAFNQLISKAVNEGFTELWISYSGHGSYLTDYTGDEKDGHDEVICPVDYESAGFINDDYIYTNLVCKLPATATLFSLMDCCNSGTVYDLPYLYTSSFITNNSNQTHVAKVCCISGCRDDQTSADAYINNNYEGAMTWSFLNAMANANYNIKLVDLCKNMRILLSSSSYTQVPQLSVSGTDQYDRVLMGSTVTPPVTTSKSIKLKLSVDYWYEESSWNIFSINENKYLFSTFNKFTSKYQTVEMTKLLSQGSYKLCIKDTYGDGGVTFSVTDGLVNLASGRMTSGKLAEYTFTV